MELKLRENTNEEFGIFKEYSTKDYANNLIKSGIESDKTALPRSINGFNSMLPNRQNMKDNFIFIGVNELN